MLDSTDHSLAGIRAEIHKALRAIETIILGKSTQIQLAVCCLLARGHCLIEDLPGVGKTTLSQTIARAFALDFNRIQFTSDLLPADILGVSIFDPDKQIFRFHPGPVFAHFLLADEINRATPKTQSALLEAMEEKQITVEGTTHRLDEPFFVIGTQNPLDQSGTFPLPESQLDRFMMKITLGYPDQAAERALLSGENPRDLLQRMRPVLSVDRFIAIQTKVDDIHCAEPLLDYVQRLIQATRNPGLFVYGISPRAGLAIIQASKAWALMNGRGHVEPGDVQAVFGAIADHRLTPSEQHSHPTMDLVDDLLEQIPIP
ncbi:MAG: MoxR family ATPase [Gammaproteobacteria bacterium]|nr:MoxR family ATPase [Gammaproteobacteria bacterium]MDH3447384.1 MoxR family ATPase [Gammaproteobacteria bacterium]